MYAHVSVQTTLYKYIHFNNTLEKIKDYNYSLLLTAENLLTRTSLTGVLYHPTPHNEGAGVHSVCCPELSGPP